jgi:hypothetical protein
MAKVRFQDQVCNDEARRAAVLAHPTLNGIDFIEVSAVTLNAERFIQVFFLKSPPPAALVGHPELFRIRGGVRIRNIKVIAVTQVAQHLQVEVDQPGDFSTYVFVIDSPALVAAETLDPAYIEVAFSFKAGCPTRFDCRPRQICPPEPFVEPLIDYLAKDYASFRQALVDLIPTLIPEWTERHEADLGITLLELFAYTGDQLSYYQDAVANEAYLETARQRISVRRHARLIDYRMHDGASARTFVHLIMQPNTSGSLPVGSIQVLSKITVPQVSNLPPVISDPSLKELAFAATDAVFETMTSVNLNDLLNKIPIHDWENRQCCLPAGATTIDLVGDFAGDNSVSPPVPAILKVGDYLLLEEVKGPRTGLSQDADPAHRQVVRLTKVEKVSDPLFTSPLTRVEWSRGDRLTFPLCLSAKLADGTFVDGISEARGNLVLADHGRTIENEVHPGPQTPVHPSLRRAHRFLLNEAPLSFRIPVTPDNGSLAPASALYVVDPTLAEPQVNSVTVPSSVLPWQAVVPDLLASHEFDPHFVVETNNDGRALLRFGDGQYGLPPPDEQPSNPAQSALHVTYRIGVGTAGNVGADSLLHVTRNDNPPPTTPDVTATLALVQGVRNPLPAWGGIDPEPIELVKQLAPTAFRAVQVRAVTEADYARAAEKHPEVSKAVATFRWTGSWLTVFITVDPLGRTDLPPALEQSIKAFVTRFTQAGYDLEIDPPIFVPLEINVDVCVALDHFKGDVEQAVLRSLSNQVFPDGQRGFFHSDNFSFGQPLFLSQLYARIKAVEGVDSALVTKFQRFGKSANNELDQGFVPMGRLEIVRLDNDASSPENGVLQLNMLGGK